MHTQRNELIEIGRYMLDRELAWGNSGNMSARVDAGSMIITASGTYMGALVHDDFVQVDLQSGVWEGGRKPSKEIPMHTAIYRQRDDVNVILHSSPFWSTLVACSDVPIVSELFIESMYYIEKVAYVDYYHPGSAQLGEAIARKAKEANVIFLKNHGIIVYDGNVKEARMRLETLEMTCRMIVTARASNVNLTRLPDVEVEDFLEKSGYKPRMKL